MSRNANRFVIIIFICCIFMIPILTVARRGEDISFYENRTKAALPKVEMQTVLNGTFFSGIDAAVSDRICFRDDLIKLNTSLDLLLDRPVVNEYVASSSALINFHGYMTWSTEFLGNEAAAVVDGITRIHDVIRSYGGYFVYVGLPQQYTYFASDYPVYMDDRLWNTEAIRAAFSTEMASRQIPFIDMNAKYRSLGQLPEYYFTTDHHYSYQGAFIAYQTILEQIRGATGFDIPDLVDADVDFITLPNPFLGSGNRALYGAWKKTDLLQIAEMRRPIDFVRFDNGVQVDSVVYALPQNETERISYSVYMGGDVGETVIKTGRSQLPSVLILGESFTNALETLIWTGFNETRSLDFRYNEDVSLQEYILEYKPDVVICVKDEGTYLDKVSNGYFFTAQD